MNRLKTLRRYLAVLTFIISHIFLLITTRLDPDIGEYGVGILMLNLQDNDHDSTTEI